MIFFLMLYGLHCILTSSNKNKMCEQIKHHIVSGIQLHANLDWLAMLVANPTRAYSANFKNSPHCRPQLNIDVTNKETSKL